MWKYLYDKVDNKACLFDVKCTKALEDELLKLGVKPVEYRTGNSYTRAGSAEGDYPLSGELSGHIYFRDKYVLTHDCYCGDNSIAHAHLDTKTVFMPKKEFEKMGVETLFDFLHEIGHLETNTDGMTRQEEEYYATTWAIDRMTKVYGFTLPESRKQDFERYISGYSSRNNKILKIKDLSEIDWKD